MVSFSFLEGQLVSTDKYSTATFSLVYLGLYEYDIIFY